MVENEKENEARLATHNATGTRKDYQSFAFIVWEVMRFLLMNSLNFFHKLVLTVLP